MGHTPACVVSIDSPKMTITWPVLLLVMAGALMHAGWNALVKSSSDKLLDTALIHVLCSLLALPVFLYLGPPPPQVWPYVMVSLVIHLGYIVLYVTSGGSSRINISKNFCFSNNSQGLYIDAIGVDSDILVEGNICVTLDSTTWAEVASGSLLRRHGIVIGRIGNSTA
jgi:hypothetical protein